MTIAFAPDAWLRRFWLDFMQGADAGALVSDGAPQFRLWCVPGTPAHLQMTIWPFLVGDGDWDDERAVLLTDGGPVQVSGDLGEHHVDVLASFIDDALLPAVHDALADPLRCLEAPPAGFVEVARHEPRQVNAWHVSTRAGRRVKVSRWDACLDAVAAGEMLFGTPGTVAEQRAVFHPAEPAVAVEVSPELTIILRAGDPESLRQLAERFDWQQAADDECYVPSELPSFATELPVAAERTSWLWADGHRWLRLTTVEAALVESGIAAFPEVDRSVFDGRVTMHSTKGTVVVTTLCPKADEPTARRAIAEFDPDHPDRVITLALPYIGSRTAIDGVLEGAHVAISASNRSGDSLDLSISTYPLHGSPMWYLLEQPNWTEYQTERGVRYRTHANSVVVPIDDHAVAIWALGLEDADVEEVLDHLDQIELTE